MIFLQKVKKGTIIKIGLIVASFLALFIGGKVIDKESNNMTYFGIPVNIANADVPGAAQMGGRDNNDRADRSNSTTESGRLSSGCSAQNSSSSIGGTGY